MAGACRDGLCHGSSATFTRPPSESGALAQPGLDSPGTTLASGEQELRHPARIGEVGAMRVRPRADRRSERSGRGTPVAQWARTC